MANQQKGPMIDFFQVFAESASKTIFQNLDRDICKKLQLVPQSAARTEDVESLKNNQAIYKIEFATGVYQGSLVTLIPEELIASISDILMGGTGKEEYKGSLSELEINSIKKLFDKVFKDIEKAFKKNYGRELVFSEKPLLLLKDAPEYKTIFTNLFLDFEVVNSLTINEEEPFETTLLLNLEVIEKIMDDLGIYRVVTVEKKTVVSPADIMRLADVKIKVTAELGRTQVPIKYALELVRGSLVELDTLNSSDIKVFANGVEFAKAQIVAVEENYGLQITKVISPEERLENL